MYIQIIKFDSWVPYGFAELSESELTTILEEKNAENTKKATKVTLKHISRLLARKRIEGITKPSFWHEKLNSRMHVCQI